MTKKPPLVIIKSVSQAEKKITNGGSKKMLDKSLSHTKSDCQYHIVFIPKYRQKRLYGAIRADVKEIIKKLCKYKHVEILEGAVCVDHVHLHVRIPPNVKVSDFMGYLKGKAALMIYDKYPKERRKWDKSFWARGYYVETVGNVSEETIKRYIVQQIDEDKNEGESPRIR